MKKLPTSLISTLVLACHFSALGEDAFQADIKPESILKATNAVANWQISNPAKHKDTDWTNGTLWTGIAAHAHTTGNDRYYNVLRDMARKNDYKLGHRKGFADDHIVGRAYLWLYLRDELPHQLAPTKEVFDEFVSRPHDESLFWKNQIHLREWAWCDSLFMGPATLAMLHSATGDRRYLDTMDKLWWKTTDYLYDKESNLFWRDSSYFERKEKNGKKVFWARGNGWVMAGLCHILQHMPSDYPSRPRYVQLFKEMSAKLKSIQQPDGAWHASLLDPASYPAPESSGTAFYTYAFTWGINNGILDQADYMPAVNKAWARLIKNVHPDGKLGFVQAIGADPQKVTMNETDVYGVGGFLMAGHELHKLALTNGSPHHNFTVTNPSKSQRLNQVIELDWAAAKAKLPSLTEKNIAIMDKVSGLFLPTQAYDSDLDGKTDTLLVQVSLTPSENRPFRIYSLKGGVPAFFPSRLHARFVPERMDDFAWESDRMAFRMYGPALAVEDVGAGVDVWTKSVRYPIIDKWYKAGDTKYHDNHGEGMDAYKVGHTLGAGGLGFLDADNNFALSSVYKTWKVIDKGPLRLRFQLTYAPLTVGKAKIAETRTITMNAGEHFFTTESTFKVEGNATGIRPVAGLYIHDEAKRKRKGFEADQVIFQNSHAIALWETLGKKEDNHGMIGTAIITPSGNMSSIFKGNDKASDTSIWHGKHILYVLANNLNQPINWHAGGVWQQADCPNETAFQHQVMRFTHENIIAPLQIKF